QYTYRDGTTLKDHVSAATYDKAQQVFAMLKLPAETMNALQPYWLVSVLDIVVNSYANKEAAAMNVLVVDLYFMTMANANGKPIRPLEGGEFQGKLFNSLSTNYLEKYLNRTLDQILTSTSLEENKDWKRLSLMRQQWRQQWIAGEKENFTATYFDMQQVADEELTHKLFGERDKDMAGKLSQLLEQAGQSTYFVVVGAGHLVLQDMVVDQLKQKGFDVQQLQY
ncbi:TraB/GumN family protein, partial [Paenibacillus popilliae]